MFVFYNIYVFIRDLEGMLKVWDELEVFFNVSWIGLVILEWFVLFEFGVVDGIYMGYWVCRIL